MYLCTWYYTVYSLRVQGGWWLLDEQSKVKEEIVYN